MTSDDAPSTGYPRPGTRFGDYLIGPEIGRGSMGVVFEATDQRLQRTVALKLLAPGAGLHLDQSHRFESEVSMLTGLGSPHVVRLLDHGEVAGRRYLAMQRIEGPDLGQLLRTDGPLPVTDALRLAGQLADALADAHRVGILHRDVKPSNVLVGLSGGELFGYLCDFGVAKTEGEDHGLTLTGGLLGTVGYLSPERARGEPATRSSDVYSLGCLLWAMLVGSAPYRGSEATVLLAHQQAPVPRLEGDDPETIAAINRVLGRSLAKTEDDRYPSIEAMRSDLRDAVRVAARAESVTVHPAVDDAGDATPATQPAGRLASDPNRSGGRRRQSGRARRRGVVAAVLVALVTLGTVVVWGAVADRGGTGAATDGIVATDGTSDSGDATTSDGVVDPDDPLAVGFPRVNQGCTGKFLVVLVGVANGDPADIVRNALDRFPGAPDRHYLSTSASCENLASIDGRSRLSALPYLGPFDGARSACRARLRYTDSSTYVIRLDEAAERGFRCLCAFEPSVLPDLNADRDAFAVGARKIWGIGLQNLLGRVGHRIRSAHTGDYDAATEAAVASFQEDEGLPVTGAMDAATWEAMQGRMCSKP